MLTWGISVGLIPPEGALAIGIISLAVFPSYLVAATNLLKTGDGFTGNIFSIFACFFALVAGASNILSWASATYGIAYPPEIGGIIWLMLSLELAFCLLAIWKKGFWSVFIQVAMATIGLFLWGVAGLGLLPGSVGYIAGWLFGFVAVLQLYFTAIEHLASWDVHLSYGPMTPPAKKALNKQTS